jgi:UDP-arabinose 4-epimerase
MRVLVTGGAGYIGSHTAKALASQGCVPVSLDNLTTGHQDSVRWGPFVYGDVGDRIRVREVLRREAIDAVIHFAASAYVNESVIKPRKYFQNNVANMLVLLEEILDAGITRVVFSSSCATYGIPSTLPINEDHPQSPINPYGDSKLFGERMLRAFGDAYGLNWVALRYFNAAGADLDGELGENHQPETHVIPLVIDSALGRRPLFEIYGTDFPTRDGTAVRDFIHVRDLANAHLAALRYLIQGGPSIELNVGSGVGHSVRDVISAVELASGRPVPVCEIGRRKGDPPALIADPNRARDVLGWDVHHSDLISIVESALKWRVHHPAVSSVPAMKPPHTRG